MHKASQKLAHQFKYVFLYIQLRISFSFLVPTENRRPSDRGILRSDIGHLQKL